MSTTTTTKRWFNTEPLEELRRFSPPQLSDFPTRIFKNQKLPKARMLIDNDYVWAVVEEMAKIPSPYKHSYVDVKVHKLSPGMGTTRLGHWHLDSSLNGDIEYDNFLFVSGEHALTEFVPVPLHLKRVKNSYEFDQQVKENQFVPQRIKSCVITRYNGRNVHRGPVATGVEKRLLVRMIKTNRPSMPTRGI